MSEYIALAGLAASALGAGANYLGGQQANRSNQNLNAGNMAYAWGQTQYEAALQREFMARQEAFQRDSVANAQGFTSALQDKGNAFNERMANNANTFTERMANNAMGFSERMSNTSYQRAMTDMRIAGLNPILAYGQGGATAPTGVSGTGVSASSLGGAGVSAPGASGRASSASVPTGQRMENALGPAVGSAMQAAQLVGNLNQLTAQRDNIMQDTALKAEQTRATQANTGLQTAQAITEGVRPDLIRAQTRTEQGRPALVGAQAAQQAASARNVEAQTETERERPGYIREQARQAGAGANFTRTQDEQRRTYGPPGPISSTVGGVSQTVDSIWQSIRNALR